VAALPQGGEFGGYRDPDKTLKRDFRAPLQGRVWRCTITGAMTFRTMTWVMPGQCRLGRSTDGHRKFMAIVLGAPRHKANQTCRSMAAIMPAGGLHPDG